MVSLKDLTIDNSGSFNPEDPYGYDNKNIKWVTAIKYVTNIEGITDLNGVSTNNLYRMATIEDINNTFAETIEVSEVNTYTLNRNISEEDDTPVQEENNQPVATYSLRQSVPEQDEAFVSEEEDISVLQDNILEENIEPTTTFAMTRSLPEQIEDNSNISYSNYINQYGHIINEFNTLIEDASYQGVNLLTGGGLNVVFNEARTHSFAVKGEDIRSDKIGLTTINWSSKSDVETAISEITSAIDKLRNLATDLGNKYTIIQTRQNFTDALTDVLETGADDLVLADMNEASAEYLMLQTRQQLAVNSLSLASQSASSILSLF